uniref:Mitochondrial fission process protein 1 n=1 Tax=Palpitomonas bilix TaxID=652834 RepID=A0A7S3D2N3_9EUKA|mmetsp:Transcript_19637/g.50306  ORF Transcript_19637/g.50306 Transcript_19637/m.50306 type:complete len:178 (+) Transcript_19637:82-615(+)
MTSSSNGKPDVPEEKDIFRDTPVRFLGYANELGESFRAFIAKKLVVASYVVSFGYVFADTAHKGHVEYLKAHEGEPEEVKESKARMWENIAISAGDTFVWQVLASVAIPGFAINRIVAASSFALKNYKRRDMAATLIGLASIPLIVEPIDHGVHKLMDYSLRRFYRKGDDNKNKGDE